MAWICPIDFFWIYFLQRQHFPLLTISFPDKPIDELQYKDLIKTGLPVSFGSTHVVLAEMVNEYRNNRCKVVSYFFTHHVLYIQLNQDSQLLNVTQS